jgi:hypothetical protein
MKKYFFHLLKIGSKVLKLISDSNQGMFENEKIFFSSFENRVKRAKTHF